MKFHFTHKVYYIVSLFSIYFSEKNSAIADLLFPFASYFCSVLTYVLKGDTMRKMKLFFINGAILTATAFIMKSVGMVFHLYVANKIGSEAIGVFSLVMAVYMFFTTIATSGLSLACTSIVAEQFSKGNFLAGLKAVRTCLLFALLLGLSSSLLVVLFSPIISQHFLKSVISCSPLYFIAIGLPFIAISSVVNGYFSAVRKGYKSAISQVFELSIKMLVTLLLLQFYPYKTVEGICICLILADVLSEIGSCCVLWVFYQKDKKTYSQKAITTITFKKRILEITLPVSITSYIRSGLSTFKQFIVPTRLTLFGFPYSLALSEYGKINGMTMSVLTFPNVFILSFSHLLIPEFTSLSAKHYKKRIVQVCQKVFLVTSLFSMATALIFFCFANEISLMVFHNLDCAPYIRILAPLIVFMYPDSILDSMLKGLNKQLHVMVCNILDLLLTISILYVLLPLFGLAGYLLAIMISEIFNFCISFLQLSKATTFKMPSSMVFCYSIAMFLGLYELYLLC